EFLKRVSEGKAEHPSKSVVGGMVAKSLRFYFDVYGSPDSPQDFEKVNQIIAIMAQGAAEEPVEAEPSSIFNEAEDGAEEKGAKTEDTQTPVTRTVPSSVRTLLGLSKEN